MFDLETPHIIAKGSVQGQFLERVYQHDLPALRSDMEATLSSKAVVGTVSKPGNTDRYLLGTVATIRHQRKQYFCVAYTTLDENNKASSSIGVLWEALDKLWAEVRIRSNGEGVAAPVIGLGQSGMSTVLPIQDAPVPDPVVHVCVAAPACLRGITHRCPSSGPEARRHARGSRVPPVAEEVVMSHLVIPDAYPSAFCDYLSGARPFTILHRENDAAILVTREQRGVSHLLVVTTRHVPTVLDLNVAEAHAVMDLVGVAARVIDEVEQRPGISVWQNNGVDAQQAIPHLHFHVAGTVPGGRTKWNEVRELSVEETELIADRLRPRL